MTLLCGTFLWLVRPTPPRSLPPAYPFTLVRFSNNAALILPPQADQRQSEISILATSETFTQRWLRIIGAGYPHANWSVNGATVSSDGCSLELSSFLWLFFGWCILNNWIVSLRSAPWLMKRLCCQACLFVWEVKVDRLIEKTDYDLLLTI